MARAGLILHHVQPGETLADIAARYGLSSWQALAFAPDNAALLERQAAGALPIPGSRLHVPPDARMLLEQRIRVVHQLRALLQRHFEALDGEHESRLPDLLERSPDADVATARELLDVLNQRVHDEVERAHAAARDLAGVNRGLLLTHLYDRDDLARYAGGDVAVVGLNWLLTPQLLAVWYGMWDAPFWVGRWRGVDAGEATALTARHLNLVRSKVLQQVDVRLRQAQAQVRDLNAE